MICKEPLTSLKQDLVNRIKLDTLHEHIIAGCLNIQAPPELKHNHLKKIYARPKGAFRLFLIPGNHG